jgi:Nucleotidyl transferase AbiEii toxin, Type IV TA system
MTFRPYFQTLPESQQRLWTHLSPAKNMGFCLYGGTALALRFGHRLSIDFDFFSALPLDKVALIEQFPILKDATVLQESPNSYVALARPPESSDQVKLSFFGQMNFGRVGKPELTDDGVMWVSSTKDLMATKLKVLFDRVELKDYIDLAVLIESGVSLVDGVCDAKALFKTFNPLYCLKTLSYFDLEELQGLGQAEKTLLSQAVLAIPSTQVFEASPILSSSLIL